ncbi:MAG: response regulator transcription factor [Candidatus Nanopelagicales bacterium]|nr:response regulator transcription factor [Candidatus Nanopelagicales bacterium]MDZ4250804.1 response regulator transcription factor [Candidatus Nanopelagicales bacterium]
MTDGSRGLVLVVEDEAAIADILRMYLRREGFGVTIEKSGEAALVSIKRVRPVAVVLDVGLPGIDGTEVVRRMRAAGDWTPVLFCTAREDEIDRILGLELGADDYITKPFSPREVVARVKAAVRRASGPGGADVLSVGEVTVDRAAHTVRVRDRNMALTATEFELLAYLMAKPGRVFSREQLLSQVWGYEAMASTRTVDVHVAQVRAKLGSASPIRTVRGVGYSAVRESVDD